MKDYEFYLNKIGEIGYVDQIRSSIVYVSGLPTVKPSEIIVFENGVVGQVLSIGQYSIEVLTFSKTQLSVGLKAVRTDEFLEIPASNGLLGRVINSLCQPMDNSGEISFDKGMSVEASPLGISARRKITLPLETGVSLVDLLIPLGKGQRELVIGDRKTGKTSFLRQAVLNQSRKGVICIYAAIGKKMMDIIDIKKYFDDQKASDNIIIVASNSQEPAGVIFLTPYTAMTIAEYFRDNGQDVLVVLDDLTTHAKFYREISLLARRFPGRESYPGDIFYIHSRLLERAGNFVVKDNKQASITCLPVAESLEGDITGYIQTNIMSMVDGHIFFDNDLFTKGRRPAINPFLSVTRVGNQTQSQIRKDIRREIITVLNLFEKSENFVHFGSTLIESTKLSLATGERILRFFFQESNQMIDSNCQSILFGMVWLNLWSDPDYSKMRKDLIYIGSLYKSDQSVSKLFDELINASTGFNDLLSKMEDKKEVFLKFITN